MISIETEIGPTEARKIIKWALQFGRNSCSDFEPTDSDLDKIAGYCVDGQDAWEAAAAIAEGRTLKKRPK